jgi:hypothetical protein
VYIDSLDKLYSKLLPWSFSNFSYVKILDFLENIYAKEFIKIKVKKVYSARITF